MGAIRFREFSKKYIDPENKGLSKFYPENKGVSEQVEAVGCQAQERPAFSGMIGIFARKIN